LNTKTTIWILKVSKTLHSIARLDSAVEELFRENGNTLDVSSIGTDIRLDIL
jgi:hypothetical protein